MEKDLSFILEKGSSPILLISLQKANGFNVSPATVYRAPLERLIMRAPRVAGEEQLSEPAVQNPHRMTSCTPLPLPRNLSSQ